MCNGRENGGGWNGKGLPAQTPLKQKHPFSSKNKPPSQGFHEWATSVDRGSSKQGQDVPLRTHLRRAQVQRLEYIDPPPPPRPCPALLSQPQHPLSRSSLCLVELDSANKERRQSL